MITRSQRLIWTALPTGLTRGGRLRLSAMVSPRLVVAGAVDDVLASFPDLLEWPDVVRAARFEVTCNGATDLATVVSASDPAVYVRLFTPTTTVLSRVFDDRRGSRVLAFPVAAMERDLAELYGRLAVEADGELPLLNDLRDRFSEVGRQLRARTREELLEGLRTDDGPPLDDPIDRLAYADLYHSPLANLETHRYRRQGPNDVREDASWPTARLAPLPAPDTFRHTMEFHAVVSALAQHPALLRLTGLVVDLEADRGSFPDGTGGTLEVRVQWTSRPNTANAGITVEPDVAPQTAVILSGDRFEARSRTPDDPPVNDGFLILSDGPYDLVQVDVNGSVLKLRQFAINMFQTPPGQPAAPGSDPVAVPPDRTGAPALRSGGLTLARRGRAEELQGRFTRSGEMEDALAAGAPVRLHLEDLVRGFLPEVHDGEWRSLMRRDSLYTFLNDLSELEIEDNEGLVRLAAAAAADGANADIVKLYEGLFTWTGWSLAAPPVGRAVGRDDAVTDAASVAPDGLPLEVEHRVRPRSLPSLRYGRRYRVRVRVADLADNAAKFDAAAPSPARAESKALEVWRFEPVEPPTIALVGDEVPQHGEDLATVAIRSLSALLDNGGASAEVARRHLVPPLGSQQLAERHGVLDGPDGRLDPLTYSLLAARDGALQEIVHPITDKVLPTAAEGARLPFLPDPLARRCFVRVAGRIGPDDVEVVEFPWFDNDAEWPDARLVRVEIFDPGDRAADLTFDADRGVLRVPLAKADHVRMRVSHALADEDLELLGQWHWALSQMGDADELDRLTELALSGQHWLFTPWRDLELVHAVQRPLVTPVVEELGVLRALGSTVAELSFTTPVDSRSTEKLDLFGRWLDPVDDPAEPGPRTLLGGGARAAELKLRRLEAPGVNPPGRLTWTRRQPVSHEFGDTRYRRVGYKLVGTTRFTKFLPPPLQEPSHADDLTVTSPADTVGYIPNSAPPPAPNVVYVIPTFGWSRTSGRSWRDGGGLRVYLRRPWLVSGFMEMLGVVLPREGDRSAVPELSSFVTQWGGDPVWAGQTVAGLAPAASRFGLRVTEGPIIGGRLDPVIPPEEGQLPAGPFQLEGLTLPGAPGDATVDVVPHLIRWDPERELWFADVVIDPGRAYAPFIRLALARYQPISSVGAHLSPVTMTEVVQLLPDRLLLRTQTSDLVHHVALHGWTPGREAREVIFEVERQGPGAVSDLDWQPLGEVQVADVAPLVAPVELVPNKDQAHLASELLAQRRFHELLERSDLLDLIRPPLIREVDITLPRPPREGERFRVVVTETEVRAVDAHHLDPEPPRGRDPRRRPVYVETFELS